MAEFTWHYNYSLADLKFRHLRLLVYRLAAFLSLIIVLKFWIVFILRSLPLVEQGYSWQIFFPPTPGAHLFWWGILFVAYAWYRLDRERAWYPPIPQPQLAETIVVDKYLTEEVWHVLEQAFRYAVRLKHAQVEPLHLLAAALKYRTGQRLFVRLGVPWDKLISTLRHAMVTLPQGKHPQLSLNSRTVLLEAGRLAVSRRAHHVDASEVLLAITKSDTVVRDVLEELAIEQQAIANITSWFSLRHKLLSEYSRRSHRAGARPKHSLDRAYLAAATPFLNKVSRDLTMLAAKGYLAPCVGRDNEIKETYRIMEGGHGSIVLIGEPGVGKTSMLEGIAQAMAAEEVPELLKDKHLVQLSLPQLLSGVTPNQASERLLHALTEIIRAGNIVLAIENIHLLLNNHSEGEISLSEILVNTISKNHILLITNTGKKEWQEVVSATSLGQVLQPVEIKELDDDNSIQVLESRVPALESEHGIFFSYGALETAVKLSRKYLPERFLPEKAIKLIEEVAIYAREHKGKHQAVTADDVAQVLALKVHVPLTQVTQSEGEKLLHLEEILHQRIVGQEEAVDLVAQALRRARVNLRDQKRPIASFLFLGPTGVGKTELAKVVAAEYFGGENKMVRLDMSEYQTAESLYRLIGAPAGVGDSAGLLTEAVRRQPYSLILLDEIEKAHPDILNVFLQLLDDGRLTDASGRTIDFTNCIIIATSNAGTQTIQEQIKNKVPLEQIRKTLLEDGLQQYFRPEFLNRFDGIVLFKPLTMTEVEKVTELLIGKLAFGLEAKGIHFHASPEAIRELAIKGFDPLFGARPLRRVIQENVDNALATHLLTGKLTRRDLVMLEPGGVVRVEKAGKL